MFRTSLKPNEHSTCGISEQMQMANLIGQARLIIWDEAPMMHRSYHEAGDRTFRYILDNVQEAFGGKKIVFSRDHRQILPVLKDATRTETLKACFDAFLLCCVYPGVGDENLPDRYFVDRANLAPTNVIVRRINELVAGRLSSKKAYLSNDSLEGPEVLVEPEFLNSLNFSGMLPHKMILKMGTPVVMIRNLNSNEGLCNGTRLRVVYAKNTSMPNIMTEPRRGKRVFVPPIVVFSNDKDKAFPFTMRRKQFPVVPVLALTINKAQGQSIHHYQESSVFAHGQPYAELFRVISRKAIKIAIDIETFDEVGSV
ncbi:LOW QUALITY PROTEIN: Helitron helicase [Phytophthora megakarya]|uniref:ATP-dependent DNA helicase n=1 Tax=Phytophthora megakarya TaxID=4795 RepID=A0A225W1T5_9STRA|nr:LOW QUALITY PROTEIN: Helitron helicase [Phytophthora megakarya]